MLAGFGWNILSMKALAVATTEEPYVTYARLKGTSNWTRMTRYVFRNALLPQVTALALSLGMVFNGALLTEMIFSYPGIGLIMRTAANGGDYNVLYGAITISIIAVATAGLVIDLHLSPPRPADPPQMTIEHTMPTPSAVVAPPCRKPVPRWQPAAGCSIRAWRSGCPSCSSWDSAASSCRSSHRSIRPIQATYMRNLPMLGRAPAGHQFAGPGHLLVPGLRHPQLADAGRSRRRRRHHHRHCCRAQRRLYRRQLRARR